MTFQSETATLWMVFAVTAGMAFAYAAMTGITLAGEPISTSTTLAGLLMSLAMAGVVLGVGIVRGAI